MREHRPRAGNSTPDAVALAACQMAYNLSADLIVVFSASGNTALRVSRYRPATPIVMITPNERAYNQMAIAWGVRVATSEDIHNTDEMVEVAEKIIREENFEIEKDGRYIVTAGVPFGKRGTTNLIRVEKFSG